MDAELSTIVASVAVSVARRFHGYTTADDLAQECWVWICSHPAKVEEWTGDSDDGIGARKLHRSLYHCALNYAQNEKATSLGYCLDDLFFYSVGNLRRLLPLYYDQGYAEPEGVHDPLGADATVFLDIQTGLKSLAPNDLALVEYVFNGDFDDLEEDISPYKGIADTYGITAQAARQKVTRILRRLQKALGGERPVAHRIEDIDGQD